MPAASPATLAQAISLANALRYTDQPHWFDFYNCRVALPERGVYFYVMPYINSGTSLAPDRTGLWVYDGGNGGPTRKSMCADERIGASSWSASSEKCDVRWFRNGAECVFSENAIRLTGPTTIWDITIESYLFDQDEPVLDPRRLKLEERGMLRLAPFVHRVPRMKGWATGFIEQQGVRYDFQRAVLYQAKNHGPMFPRQWTWIQANDFIEDSQLAFEVAGLQDARGDAAMLRIIRPEGVRMLSTWAGDSVSVSRSGLDYRFAARSGDGAVNVAGLGRHDPDNVLFRYACPEGGTAENDESFTGSLEVTINGQTCHARLPALGLLRKI